MQMIRKILLAAGAAALMSTPAWALPSQTPSNGGTEHAPATTPVGPPTTTPNNTNNPGSANRHHGKASGNGHKGSGDDSGSKGSSGAQHGNSGTHGKSHKCVAHKVGYVASGTLVSQTLTKNADGTYSGEVVVEVTHANHHAAADKGKTVTYTVANIHVTFGLADTNSDGSVGVDDLVKGDRTHLIGKITTLAKKCDRTEFKATTTIRKIVFHAPATKAPKA
jgi:hypothetical protein